MKTGLYRILLSAGVTTTVLATAPAYAQGAAAPSTKEEAKAPFGGPVAIGNGWTLDPIVDARLRYESVDQDEVDQDAEALTIRLQAGIEAKSSDGLSFLIEGEGSLAAIDDYNDTNPGNGLETNNDGIPYSVVADPQTVELNRIQVAYEAKDFGKVTVGRQRIVLGDSRWVGNVGWRNNEQTFDAARIELNVLDPVTIDFTTSNSQRTIFGVDADNRTAFDGDFQFVNVGGTVAGINITGFAYFLDYDGKEQLGGLATAMADTQTFGAIATGKIPVLESLNLTFKASYAVQKDYAENPFGNFSADYIAAELGASVFGFGLTGGYEQLGSDVSDTGVRVAVQTPMATLHKFNGFSDNFLVTPAAGIRDYYVTVGRKLPEVKLLPGLNASVTYHQFDSEDLGLDYGEEWDAVLGFKLKGVGVTLKYANYDAHDYSTDTEKFWAQLSYSF